MMGEEEMEGKCSDGEDWLIHSDTEEVEKKRDVEEWRGMWRQEEEKGAICM